MVSIKKSFVLKWVIACILVRYACVILTKFGRFIQTNKLNKVLHFQESVKNTHYYNIYGRTRPLVSNTSLHNLNTINTILYDHPYRRLELNRSFGSDYHDMEWYFKLRPEQQISLNYSYIHTTPKCLDGPPFLVILCLSQPEHSSQRETIRTTWGSVNHTHMWPRYPRANENIKLVFLLGYAPSTKTQNVINKEFEVYRDIIQSNFTDSYTNLTIKVLMGLKWTSLSCPGTKYVLKVDEDTFIHVPNLVNYLKYVELTSRGVVFGWVFNKPPVKRKGDKWSVQNEVYPFPYFPKYTSGNAYVISGNIIDDIYKVAKYLPYLFIEDAFITGVVRSVIGAKITHSSAFTHHSERAPKSCGFHNKVRIAATNANVQLMKQIWKALHQDIKDCSQFSLQENKSINL